MHFPTPILVMFQQPISVTVKWTDDQSPTANTTAVVQLLSELSIQQTEGQYPHSQGGVALMVAQDPQPEVYETVHDFADDVVQNTSVTKTVYTSQGSGEQVRIYAVQVRILDGTTFVEETTRSNDFGLTIMAGANNVPSNEFHIGPIHASRDKP